VSLLKPLSTLLFYINDTYEGTRTYANNFTQYAIEFKSGLDNSSMPIIANDTYTIKFVAVFQNGLATVANTRPVAGS
jgi:hypothetical protein